jgi:hypothetical protein
MKARVAALGAEIGFGNLMHTAQECWRESNAVRGIPAGAEHIVGPCAVMAAPCGCENGRCDWCCGSGWLTHRVKQAKEASGE